MGKIFKALEKAEKHKLVDTLLPTEKKHKIQEPNLPEPSTRSASISRPDGSAVPADGLLQKGPIASQSNPELIAPINKPRPSKSIDGSAELGVAPSASLVEGQANPRMAKKTIAKNTAVPNLAQNKASERVGVTPAEININAIRSVEGPSISPNRHEELAIPTPVQPSTRAEVERPPEVLTKTVASKPKAEVKVRYSKTKVQVNDPELLKNNRVFSIAEDIETTNQFKILRTQVLRKLKEIGGNSLLVTSANPCEGKTFTSINLGVSIAKEFDRTVLIIDADIRRPAQKHTDFSTEFFSLKVEKGLTDYLAGDVGIEDILINPGIDKLTLIPGGMPVDNSPELLNSAKMEEMMREIKSRYPSDRLVIVDGPAILHFPDAMILCRYVDGVLPVIESEKTSAEDLKKMMNHLTEVKILGTVLNKSKK